MKFKHLLKKENLPIVAEVIDKKIKEIHSHGLND